MYRSLSALGALFGRMVKGVGAAIIQGYDEVNKKRGKQWEVSRSVQFSSAGDKSYSVLRIGSEYVDLKSRVLGATGGGAIGRAYRIQPADVTFRGTPRTWYNYHSEVLTQPLTEVYLSDDVTFNTPIINLAIVGNLIHAPIYAITNSQNQGKGFTPAEMGGNHILAPNDIILLELESFDSSQTATAKLSMYEGELDFYPN